MKQIQYIDRQTGNTITEDIPANGIMNFLYGQNPLGKLTLNALFKRKFISSWGGKYMNSKVSLKRIPPFIKEYNINMDDFIIPDGGFKHFNNFFYRKVKEGKRPIGKHVISPADGRVLAFQSIKDVPKFFVKGSEFDLNSFIQDENIAANYQNGSMVIIRLAPVDYHRYHFPTSGMVSKNTKIKGDYYSVSPIALRKSLAIFLQNKREYVTLSSPNNGDILIMDVGATMTGSIIQTHQENTQVNKGDEKGYFAFGGSTIVLLFEENAIKLSHDLVQNTTNGLETFLKMGETIGK